MRLGLRRVLTAFLAWFPLATGGGSDSPSPDPHIRPDDDEKDIEGMLETFRDLMAQLTEDGRELSALCAQAGRKAAHYALLSETIIESVTSGILVIDRAGHLLFANSSAKRILDLEVGTHVAGMSLDALFKDGSELGYLVRQSLESGMNASREIREVVSLAGRDLRLGISTSCVGSDPASVDAVIVIFASLGEDPVPLPESNGDAAKAIERQNYLRGVLDSYDLISGLFVDFDRIEQKSNTGTLTTSELREFSGSLRRACDTLMAFALSLGAIDSIPELVEVNTLIETVVTRVGFEGDLRLAKRLADDPPMVKTLRKVLEVGLCLLIKGCMNQSRNGVEVASIHDTGGPRPTVAIDVKELSPSKPIRKVGTSLREFVGGGDMQREAGLFLLASLPPDWHTIEADQVDGVFRFSLRMGPPIDREVGPRGRSGEISDRGRDGN